MDKLNLLKIKKTTDSLNRLNYYSNTKSFINYTKNYTTLETMEIKKAFNLVESGKIAIFPVYQNQNTGVIYNHIKLNIDCYLLPYKEYKKLKEKYIDSLVLSTPEREEIKQQSLF